MYIYSIWKDIEHTTKWPKPYEYKDVKNRGSKRVYGFISQLIAEVIPEAVSVQKGTLYDIHSNLNVMEIEFYNRKIWYWYNTR